jgi:FADH2 O2-dependent halogenase
VPDVVVMGGGPAGLTLGCYLARVGIEHVILERGHHPRPRVGESLLPSALRVFDDIGFLTVLEEAGFPRSPGVAYHTAERESPIVIGYGEFPGDGPTVTHSHHADRARLDMLLMKHAESEGCRIVQGTAVRSVRLDAQGVARGVIATVGTETLEIDARIVVDATGHQTLIGRQLGLRSRDPDLDQIGLHGWFEGVDRGPASVAEHVQVHFLPVHRGWAWVSPISPTITSVGLVTDRASFQHWDSGLETYFDACAGTSPSLARALAGARAVRGIRAEPSMNYSLSRVAGDGWLAIGDAARFVDPVFSSGVGVAVDSARLASRTIRAALDANDVGAQALTPYQDETFTIASVWRDFVQLYYRLMPAFTLFVESPRHRPGILRFLQGDVGHPDDAPLLDEMKKMVDEAENPATP